MRHQRPWAVACLALATCMHSALAASSSVDSAVTIAVIELKQGAGVDSAQMGVLTDRLRGELVATGAFRVLDRESMGEILREQGFQQTGACEDTSCVVRVGQLLAVRRMVSGSVGMVDSRCAVNVKITDVESGQIVGQAALDLRGEPGDLLAGHLRDLAHQLAGLAPPRRRLVSRWYFWTPLGLALGVAAVVAVVVADGDPAQSSSGESTLLVEGTLQ